MTKHHANQLGFAVLLAFFRDRGRFPRTASETNRAIVQDIARPLGIQVPGDYALILSGRTAEARCTPRNAVSRAFDRAALG
jgi:Domain of unknown function (DUF4158)